MHTFGIQQITTKSAGDFIAEAYKAAGATGFPIQLTVSEGEMIGFGYESEWMTGDTEPVEAENKDGELEIIDYKQVYKSQALTKAQIDKLESWVKANIKDA